MYKQKKTQEHKITVDQSTKHRHLRNFAYWCRFLPCVGNYICFDMIYWNVSLGTLWCNPEIQLQLFIWIHSWVLSVVKCTTTPGVWISSPSFPCILSQEVESSYWWCMCLPSTAHKCTLETLSMKCTLRCDTLGGILPSLRKGWTAAQLQERVWILEIQLLTV